MQKILIIGDRYSTCDAAVDACCSILEKYEIKKAYNKNEAATILQSNTVTLCVCDMSSGYSLVVDSFGDLTFQFPHIPFIAIVDPDQKLEKNVMDLGGAACLRSPLTPYDLKSVILQVTEHAVGGTLRGIALYSLLQMMENDETTCTLQVTSGTRSATIYLEDGVPATAETSAGLLNEEALYSALVWEEAAVVIHYYNRRRRREIEAPLMAIIIEAYKRQDDGSSLANNPQTAENSQLHLKNYSIQRDIISFETGATVRLELDATVPEIMCTIAGVTFNQFIILSPPKSLALLEEARQKKLEIALKYVHKGKLYWFRTRIIEEITFPTHLLFMEYPETIQYLEMRRAKRSTTFVPASLQCTSGTTLEGVLTDISRIGCQFASREEIATCRSDLDIDSDIEIITSIPGLEEKQRLRGKVKNIQKSQKAFQFGIYFDGLPEKIQGTLARYLASTEGTGSGKR